MAKNIFEETMNGLYNFLEGQGFYNSERQDYMEMNENGDCLSEAVSNFLEENPKQRAYKFSVSSECAFESPGFDVYVTSIAFAYYNNDNLIVESIILESYCY